MTTGAWRVSDSLHGLKMWMVQSTCGDDIKWIFHIKALLQGSHNFQCSVTYTQQSIMASCNFCETQSQLTTFQMALT